MALSGGEEKKGLLAGSNELLEALLGMSKDVLYVVDLATSCIVYATPSFAQRLALPEDCLAQGFHLRDYLPRVHPEDQERLRTLVQAARDSRTDEELPAQPTRYRLQRPGGGWYIIRETHRVLRREGGQAHALIGNCHDATEEEQVREALRASEERFQALAENSRDIFFSLRFPEVRYEYISPCVEEIFGRTPQDFYRDSSVLLQCVAPEWRAKVGQWLEEIARGEVREKYEFAVVDRHGRTRWFSQRQVYASRPGAQGMLLQGVVLDMTKEREADLALRQSEERYRQLIEAWPEQVILAVNLTRERHEYVSPSMERVLGYAPQEFYDDLGLGMAVVAPQWQEQAFAWMAEIRAGLVRPEYVFELVHKNGEHRWIHQVGALRPREPGQDQVVQFTFHDFTERRQLEEQLLRSQAFLDCVLEQSPVSMWISDENGTLIRTNQALRERLKITDEEVVGRFNIFQDNQAREQGVMPRIRRVYEQGGTDRFELTYDTSRVEDLDLAQASQLVLDFTISAVRNEKGRTTNLIIQHVDITEQKRLAEELAQKDALLRGMLRNLPFDFWARDHAGHVIMQSDESIRLWGDLATQPQLESGFSERTLEQWRTANGQALAGGTLSEEKSLVLPSGEERTYHAVVAPIREGEGILGILGINVDITDRRRAEEALRLSNERYALLAYNVVDVIWSTDENLRWTYLSPSIEMLCGVPVPVVLLRSFPEIFSPASVDIAWEAVRAWNQITSGEFSDSRTLQMEIIHAEGHLVPIEVLARPLRGPAGEITGYCGTARDITERRQTEAALRLSEERYALALRGASDGIWDWDLVTDQVYYSDRWKEIIGYAPDELRHDAGEWTSRIHPEDIDRVMEENMRCIRGEDPVFQVEYRLRHKDGTYRWIFGRGAALADAEGRVVRMGGAHTDITARRQAEEALAASERRFSELIRNSSDSITILDSEGVQVFVSDVVERMLGFSPAELTNINVMAEMVHPEDQHKVQAAFAAILRDCQGGAQYRHRHKNGSWVHLEAWGTNQLDNPDIRGIVVNVRDVTERVQAEEAQRKSDRQFRKLLESMHEGVWAVDAQPRTIFVNERLCAMLGYSQEEMSLLTPLDVTAGSFRQQALENYHARRLGKGGVGEYELVRKDGSRFPAQVISSPMMDEEGRFEGLVAGVVDLTERVRMEKELRRGQARSEALFELSRLTGTTEQQIASYTLRQAMQLSGSQGGALFFVVAEGKDLRLLAHDAGGCDPLSAFSSLAVKGSGPWAKVLATAAPVLLNDAANGLCPGEPGGDSLPRFLAVPALSGPHCAAILGVAGKEDPYTEDDALQLSLLMDGMWRIVRGRRDEERIRASLREKEVLLREVHHRVKNNLQVVSSLLDMAGRRLDAPAARQALDEVQSKVLAMSLIHAQLYGSRDLRGIRLGDYVDALFHQLSEVYAGGINLSARFTLGNLVIGLDQAVPLGLVLNEALANVFKHAAPQAQAEGRQAVVEVRGSQDLSGVVEISVCDNGPGLPEGMDPQRATSLGLKLMRGIVQRQLQGQLTLMGCGRLNGTCVLLCFRPEAAPPASDEPVSI